MMRVHILQESKTTLKLSQYLIPMLGITCLAVVSTLATFGMTFYPAKARLEQTQALHQAAQQTQVQTQTAKQTQEILASTWKALPHRFSDLPACSGSTGLGGRAD